MKGSLDLSAVVRFFLHFNIHSGIIIKRDSLNNSRGMSQIDFKFDMEIALAILHDDKKIHICTKFPSGVAEVFAKLVGCTRSEITS